MLETVTVDPRFNGPPGCANGGYFCGRVAAALQQGVSVRLHRPVPLSAALTIQPAGAGEWRVLHGEDLLATATAAEVDIAAPQPPTYLQALAAAQHYPGFKHHLFPRCFVCGPERAQGDGLRVFPGRIDGRVAAPWLPDISLADADGKVRPEFMWAALDCPGYYASVPDNRPALLGELAVRVERRIPADEPCVVVAWPISVDGRKHRVGAALYSEEGGLCALGMATWIELKS